jgi:predicted ATP-dependent endonuclease of OLD family
MHLAKARIRDYRSIRDTEWFEIEDAKTILVGPNEAGKTTVLRALEAINPPGGVSSFNWLRDYPRAKVNDIQTKKVQPSDITVIEATFSLSANEKDEITKLHSDFKNVTQFTVGRRLDNERWWRLEGGPAAPILGALKKDFARLIAHLQGRASDDLIQQFHTITGDWNEREVLSGDRSNSLKSWLESIFPYIEENNATEEARYDKLLQQVKIKPARDAAVALLGKHIPLFVYFNNYFQVKPSIHLRHLAARIENNVLDDETYDFGNKCLLQLLGFTAQELADLGEAEEPELNDHDAVQRYKEQLDRRHYSLNAAQVSLTEQIQEVWIGEEEEEKLRLRLHADRQYLKAVVEDELGVEVELDQRSAGFQWLVSFFVVFRAQAEDQYSNAILLLDEPGLSLHGLKQRQFRKTVSKLAVNNQTIYSTHSPFMVGPDELPIVRIVEMVSRRDGTKVHTDVVADDPRSLFPLQEALGYDLAQSLFAQQKNLVCEGLTDYWYLDGTAVLLRESKIADLEQKIAIVPAKSASKVVYYATILHSQRLKVAALLDSDQAGEQATTQDDFVRLLGQKRVLRTKDAYDGPVTKPEIEDLLRSTLVHIAKNDLGWDISATAASQPARPIIDIFTKEITSFSKYKLVKAYLQWVSRNDASALTPDEQRWWKNIIGLINKALK